ncbi:carboxylating nicotinate-nucleotide diphosphorylase [Methanobacterium sp. CWC-01]|uniref:carboxylating nicotinate-nucleotide diphosphorylase n=1 Tax=Methanobacterium aridiramus TaxID=2584467 RepID=UPI002578D6A9|nr:carboxylating nicotinate-nucleotide diphosphorylase [Methanobacterium sp. CWC-01]WJI10073.1 carboxylating nicotinate-nucleotide diphosphorylase [Methanobacterium sp. CWC-01]
MRQDLARLVYEDMGFEDLTTQALIPSSMRVKGRILAREEGVVAGLDLALSIFKEFSVQTFLKKQDGDRIAPQDVLMEFEGEARSILSVERTVLNLLMRMSGIATLTDRIIRVVREVNPTIIVAGTRKTTPGLQFYEKSAIRVGGGDTHRYRLDDQVLIKDNHLALVGSVTEAVERARKHASFTKKIEVEADTLDQAFEAAQAGADIVLLDNMSPEEVETVLSALKDNNLRDKVLVEVSGGINPNNILAYAKLEADVISTGYITHSAPSLNLSLEVDGN